MVRKRQREWLQIVFWETQAGHKVTFLHKVGRAALAQVTERSGKVSIMEGWFLSKSHV